VFRLKAGMPGESCEAVDEKSAALFSGSLFIQITD
jgi:hypothetical protein